MRGAGGGARQAAWLLAKGCALDDRDDAGRCAADHAARHPELAEFLESKAAAAPSPASPEPAARQRRATELGTRKAAESPARRKTVGGKSPSRLAEGASEAGAGAEPAREAAEPAREPAEDAREAAEDARGPAEPAREAGAEGAAGAGAEGAAGADAVGSEAPPTDGVPESLARVRAAARRGACRGADARGVRYCGTSRSVGWTTSGSRRGGRPS